MSFHVNGRPHSPRRVVFRRTQASAMGLRRGVPPTLKSDRNLFPHAPYPQNARLPRHALPLFAPSRILTLFGAEQSAASECRVIQAGRRRNPRSARALAPGTTGHFFRIQKKRFGGCQHRLPQSRQSWQSGSRVARVRT